MFVYVPNLIGYARVVLASIALAYAFEDVPFALGAYFLSFVCDELDGRFARMFDQCSEFGKLLDMVTDRLATAGLLMVLSAKFPEWFFACLALLLLDIGSHWLQMYTSVLASRKSHKDVAANANIILRLYYTDRIFMGVCCVSAEVLYLCARAVHGRRGGYEGSPASRGSCPRRRRSHPDRVQTVRSDGGARLEPPNFAGDAGRRAHAPRMDRETSGECRTNM